MEKQRTSFDYSSLYKKEDWWACWIGFFILALCVSGIIGIAYKLPKVQKWVANPLNARAIEDIELLTGCNVQTFVSTTSDVKEAINKYFKAE